MSFESQLKIKSGDETLTGATPEQMLLKLKSFLKFKASDTQGYAFETGMRDLRKMAKGAQLDIDETEINHDGGEDESGPYVAFSEIKKMSLRERSYPEWRDEDFAELLTLLGETPY